MNGSVRIANAGRNLLRIEVVDDLSNVIAEARVPFGDFARALGALSTPNVENVSPVPATIEFAKIAFPDRDATERALGAEERLR